MSWVRCARRWIFSPTGWNYRCLLYTSPAVTRIAFMEVSLFSKQVQLQRLKYPGRAHAGADAHGDHAVFSAAPAQAVHQRGGADRAGRAQRMAERDRPAERVDLSRRCV